MQARMQSGRARNVGIQRGASSIKQKKQRLVYLVPARLPLHGDPSKSTTDRRFTYMRVWTYAGRYIRLACAQQSRRAQTHPRSCRDAMQATT
jgi:hypothetical protein